MLAARTCYSTVAGGTIRFCSLRNGRAGAGGATYHAREGRPLLVLLVHKVLMKMAHAPRRHLRGERIEPQGVDRRPSGASGGSWGEEKRTASVSRRIEQTRTRVCWCLVGGKLDQYWEYATNNLHGRDHRGTAKQLSKLCVCMCVCEWHKGSRGGWTRTFAVGSRMEEASYYMRTPPTSCNI